MQSIEVMHKETARSEGLISAQDTGVGWVENRNRYQLQGSMVLNQPNQQVQGNH